MSHTSCAVTIKQLPEKISIGQARLLIRELASSIDVERPCIVFDCSRILQMDIPTITLLLDCLEVAMKRNGDIKLATLHEQAKAMLQLTGVDHLFEMFDTSADAAKSFHRLVIPAALQGSTQSATSHRIAENAA
jgi:anti-anti-sigma factor